MKRHLVEQAVAQFQTGNARVCGKGEREAPSIQPRTPCRSNQNGRRRRRQQQNRSMDDGKSQKYGKSHYQVGRGVKNKKSLFSDAAFWFTFCFLFLLATQVIARCLSTFSNPMNRAWRQCYDLKFFILPKIGVICMTILGLMEGVSRDATIYRWLHCVQNLYVD